MTHFLGIDISTTATKTLLINSAGEVVDVAVFEYSYNVPQPLWSEQDPGLWWDATVKGVRKVLVVSGIDPTDIQGIGLTGQMHGLVLLGESGDVLRPAILWNDQRTGSQCDEIRSRLGRERLIQITGNDALTGFTAPKILWVQQNEPETWSLARQILLPKDFVRYKLTGTFAVDRAGGAGTMLFDIRQRTWSPEMLSALEIPTEYIPETYEGSQVSGLLSDEAAEMLGLPAGIPVVGGGGDQTAAAVGTGAVEEGIVSLSLGTSGVVFASTDQPVIDPQGRLHTFCHAVPGKWHLMGVMLSAAGSLRWHRDTFAPEMDFATLTETTRKIPAGSDGLIFLPYLTGERTPHPDPLARGAFIGLTIRHTLAHMTRAVLEGVSFGLKDSFELMKKAGLTEISHVRVTGGGAKSGAWRQILADVLGVEIITVNTEEGAAFGAALLAAVGTGHFPDVSAACNQTIQSKGSTIPGKDYRQYQELYSIYVDMYPKLKSIFHSISRLA